MLPEVMWAVSKGTVRSILNTVSSGICLIHTCAGLVVAQVVASLCVTCCAMQIGAAAERGRGELYDRRHEMMYTLGYWTTDIPKTCY